MTKELNLKKVGSVWVNDNAIMCQSFGRDPNYQVQGFLKKPENSRTWPDFDIKWYDKEQSVEVMNHIGEIPKYDTNIWVPNNAEYHYLNGIFVCDHRAYAKDFLGRPWRAIGDQKPSQETMQIFEPVIVRLEELAGKRVVDRCFGGNE